MGTLPELKELLGKLNYPNLNVLGDEEIFEIFLAENRRSFLTWFVQKLIPGIVLPEDPQESADIIADVICEHGFCTSSQKHVFVQGDNSLNMLKQLDIVARMLSYLREGQDDKENVGAPCNTIDVEDVARFMKMDINLFPTYGTMKTRKCEDRFKKIQDIDRQIVEVKKEIEDLEDEEITSSDYNTNVIVQEDVNIISALEEATVAFHNLVKFLVDRNGRKESDFQPKFSNGFSETVVKCDAKIQTVADVVQSLSAVSNFLQDSQANVRDETDRNVDLITQLATMSNKVKMGNNTHSFS